MRVEFGIATGRAMSMNDVAEQARAAEEYGFSYLGICDQPSMDRDVHLMMAAAAQATKKLRVGHSVTDPHSFHPWVIANATATVDELSGGRAFIGLGAGGPFGKVMAARPAEDLRAAVLFIRRFMSGEEAEFRGIRMQSEWIRRPVPIYMACEGPRACELAGELADGIVTARCHPEYIKWKLEHVERGAQRAGRQLKDLDIRLITMVYITQEKQKALRESAGFAMNVHRIYQMLQRKDPEVVDLRSRLQMHDPGLIEDIKRVYEAWTPDQHEKVDQASGEFVNERVSDFVNIVGTAEEVRERIAALAGLGVTTIECAFYTVLEPLAMMRKIREELMPTFQQSATRLSRAPSPAAR